MLSYTERMNRSPIWAVHEGGSFFEGRSAVNRALTQITKRLDELGIPYAVAGGMAVFQHGLRRFTEDVDLLVRKEDLPTIHERLEGRGYLPKFKGSKNLRDTQAGVAVEFLVAGEYPGDGKPKPVAFPDPLEVAIEMGGVKYLRLPSLIELKIASGSTVPDRVKDIADVQQLVGILLLPRDFQDQLDPSVREQYDRIWLTMNPERRFLRILELDEIVPHLQLMLRDGVELEESSPRRLVTTDPVVAARYDLHDEREFM